MNKRLLIAFVFAIAASLPARAVDKSCPLSVHEGPLCGELLILGAKDIPPNTTMDKALNLPQKTVARRGDKIIVNVLAGGMQRDSKSSISVLGRIWITPPGGRPPQELASTRPAGIEGPAPKETSIVEAAFNGFAFDKGDVAGIYTISAEVKDRRGKNSLHIIKTITLLP
jgi:hypothetical protein